MSVNKTFIVAEIGNNHEGNFNLALKLIDAAKNSGADAVKFQTFDTDYFLELKTNKEEIELCFYKL